MRSSLEASQSRVLHPFTLISHTSTNQWGTKEVITYNAYPLHGVHEWSRFASQEARAAHPLLQASLRRVPHMGGGSLDTANPPMVHAPLNPTWTTSQMSFACAPTGHPNQTMPTGQPAGQEQSPKHGTTGWANTAVRRVDRAISAQS